MIEIKLPFPPAVNNITAVVRGRKITSKRGREYRKTAVARIAEQFTGVPLTGRLAVRMVLIPPCRRKRDIDNYSKAALDAITAAGVWIDDEQIDQLTIIRGDRSQGGGCLVQIEEVAA
ncbi:RusA family crossover junction endodeoxyribonuclease [Vreelandella venusta]|uniref:RusA family crossover junction endodeoxyribonuclease n=1 Tax=Vreelandella venusta TaxID=44935 RepID=UPI003AA8DCE8